VIALATDSPHYYDQAKINLASSVASSVSQALQNAQLFEEVQQYGLLSGYV
jgi:GAF domain-containing protein